MHCSIPKGTSMAEKTSTSEKTQAHSQRRTEGGFQGFQETPLDFTQYLKHLEIDTSGFQNLESVMEQYTFKLLS